MSKTKITKQIHDAYLDFDGKTPDGLIRIAEELKERYGSECFILSYIDCDDVQVLGLFKEEEETDYEYQLRLDREKHKEEYERTQYERLKKKFENT